MHELQLHHKQRLQERLHACRQLVLRNSKDRAEAKHHDLAVVDAVQVGEDVEPALEDRQRPVVLLRDGEEERRVVVEAVGENIENEHAQALALHRGLEPGGHQLKEAGDPHVHLPGAVLEDALNQLAGSQLHALGRLGAEAASRHLVVHLGEGAGKEHVLALADHVVERRQHVGEVLLRPRLHVVQVDGDELPEVLGRVLAEVRQEGGDLEDIFEVLKVLRRKGPHDHGKQHLRHRQEGLAVLADGHEHRLDGLQALKADECSSLVGVRLVGDAHERHDQALADRCSVGRDVVLELLDHCLEGADQLVVVHLLHEVEELVEHVADTGRQGLHGEGVLQDEAKGDGGGHTHGQLTVLQALDHALDALHEHGLRHLEVEEEAEAPADARPDEGSRRLEVGQDVCHDQVLEIAREGRVPLELGGERANDAEGPILLRVVLRLGRQGVVTHQHLHDELHEGREVGLAPRLEEVEEEVLCRLLGAVVFLHHVVFLADVLLGVALPELAVQVVEAEDREDDMAQEVLEVRLHHLVGLGEADAV
mmetsp:Transcript_7440/g.31532  ORF Transcript_7440/g.31532 Transcript_7440/m.31532 type:complete len:537 (-) Transcript_7440:1138-2748(-)